MINTNINDQFDDDVTETKTKHNSKWPYIPDHPYRILIIGDSGSTKTNALLNLINNQSDIDKIYLYAKDPYEAKYQFLIKKRESTGLKRFNDHKLLLVIQTIWKIFIKILMKIILIKNVKY